MTPKEEIKIEQESKRFWLNVREKVVLLALGGVASVIAVLLGSFYGQFVLKADYNEDKIQNAVVVTTFQQGFKRVEEKLDHTNEELKRINKRLEKLK